jgi:hypothetical protein
LQATLVFGLLRYARNDKKQDGREAQGTSHDNSYCICYDNLFLITLFLEKENLYFTEK